MRHSCLSRCRRFVCAGVSLLLPAVALCGVYRYSNNNYTLGPNVTVPANDTHVYEAINTIQTSGAFSVPKDAALRFNAGGSITLNPGFHAHDESFVWLKIDANFNGISDYAEGQDADGDGYFDALENVLGTSSGQPTEGFEVDGDGDGIFDRVVDASHGGTPSQFYPGAFMGYQDRLRSFYTAFGTYNSVSASFGDGWIGTFFSDFQEWIEFNFQITYEYFSFAGWQHGVSFDRELNKTYVLQSYFPGTGWSTVSNEITYTDPNQPPDWTGYSNNLVATLSLLPLFMRVIEIGKGTPATNPGTFDDVLSIAGLGEVLGAGDQLKLTLPEVLSIPAALANTVDWAALEKKVYGNTTPWQIDIDGDGVTDVTLDPINRVGKVSIPMLGKQVEITVDSNGVQVGLGKFKVRRTNNGEFVVDLPTDALGTDGTLSLSFSSSLGDLDIEHPASGVLGEDKEDIGDGGYVSRIRQVNGNDVAPITKLVMRKNANLPARSKLRLKFDSGGRYRLYSDVSRTTEVISQQTEFTPVGSQDVVLYFKGLKTSLSLGGEKIELEIQVNNQWHSDNSLTCTVVQSEFDIVHRVFIPYNWVNVPHPAHAIHVAEGDDRTFDSTLTGTFRVEQSLIVCPFPDLSDVRFKEYVATPGLSRHFYNSDVVNHTGAIHSAKEPMQPSYIAPNALIADGEQGLADVSQVTVQLLPEFTSPEQTFVKFQGAAKEPIVFAAAPIDWRFNVIIRITNPIEPTVSFAGIHDGSPAYELYLSARISEIPVTEVLTWAPDVSKSVLELLGGADTSTPVVSSKKIKQ